MPTPDVPPTSGPKRKPYVKPELSVIALRADEVLAVGCKSATGGPPPRAKGCKLGGCFKAGS